MLALIGVLTIATLLFFIMSKRMSPLVALIVIPIIGALVAGSGTDTAKYIIEGITKLAPMAAMFVFAITFFGVITDAGMFDPIIRGILRFVGTNPVKIIIGTGILALIAHLDGNGAVTFLITIPTMLPLFHRLGMDKRILVGITALSAGVNFLPWTGPMIRASAALNIPTHDLFIPLIPAQICGLIFMVGMGWYWGKKEEKRLGIAHFQMAAGDFSHNKELTDQEKTLRRPHLFWLNLALVIAVIGTMVLTRISPTVAFMVALTVALMINYPNVEMQKERINAHAKAALMMASILFAAGAFTGIMGGTGMLKAMSEAAVGFMPESFASHIPFIVGLIAMPLSLVFDPDSYYFGIMPVIAHTVQLMGIPAIQVAQASVLGQMTTGFAVSPLTPATFLLVSLAGVDLADHQKFSIPVLWAASVIMTFAAAITGVFPF
ncbi:Citrate transporter [Yersinia frederiksenii]|uniref:Citrate transporter n=2 Tax=Yersinia frederiksenii TaxID=29484 RepID=A0A380Q041_YERFR|nr:citrate:proton symporter [Yersinia frederiksenii]ATM96499.1 citrate transporter [Yersinia frederiksenii]EEQ13724.1 Citrate/H+ symporter, CitMHS family [Yersinia frederiksenii ATCC 33641]KGA48314.1 citrate transporter family protein [Yersinia frederiksenii ATCC 33641]CFR04955.1 Citrate transporter [Yersinia frederiksenii]CNC12005.1 Citrate transporter [Yersinia frederiksenii]